MAWVWFIWLVGVVVGIEVGWFLATWLHDREEDREWNERHKRSAE